MNISYKWLQRFIDVSIAPREMAAALTSLGLECDTVEEVESVRGGLRGVVIGKVLTCVDHPNSDHLHITTCDLGTGEPVKIVCGAPNVAAGQTVVVATVGTSLYDGDKEIKIKKSKIRGEESFGMICAEDELGIGTSHDGIIVIDEDVTPGTPAAEYFNIESDFCLEVELTPNRVDAASHLGVARDLRAWMARNSYSPENSPAIQDVRMTDVSGFVPDSISNAAEVMVEDTKGCPRYGGVTVRGVKVTESPEWLRKLLVAAGQRPINNIVDITNFILLGLGQPLHSFDLDKVEGGKIIVRRCEKGTEFTTLDGVKRTLHEDDVMICDSVKPLCIAGVFGGEESGVSDSTRNVFIESAYFNPTSVRKTARRHGLSTDASFRYERGTDPNIIPYAAKLAALLIKEVAGGEICGDIIDTRPEGFPSFPVELNLDYCDSLIGKKLPRQLIVRILESLDIKILPESGERLLKLEVPPYRVDVTRPCDVVEEILRVYGYNNVEFGEEMHATLSRREDTDESYRLQNMISEMLSASGFNEIMNNSLTAVSYYENSADYPFGNCVKIMNPLSRDLGVMRQTLLFGGLETLERNINRKNADLRLYEFGNIYRFNPAEENGTCDGKSVLNPYSEEMHLALWLTGDQKSASWNSKAEEVSFYDLRGYVENIFRRLGIDSASLKYENGTSAIYSHSLDVFTQSGKKLGSLGELSKKILKVCDISRAVVYGEFDWNVIYKLAKKHAVTFIPLPKTQPVRRDLALLIDKQVIFSDIEKLLRQKEKNLLRSVRLFDVYEGKNLPAGKKSYAIEIILQDKDKTLQDKQIDAVMSKFIKTLTSDLGAELR